MSVFDSTYNLTKITQNTRPHHYGSNCGSQAFSLKQCRFTFGQEFLFEQSNKNYKTAMDPQIGL